MTDKDLIQRYLFEDHNVRGEIVQLDKSWQAILANYNYPPIIQIYLGEIVAATALLAATLKIDGSLSIQASGNGIINLLVAECRQDLSIRAVAKYDKTKLDKYSQGFTDNDINTSQLSSLLSGGTLVITIEQNKGQRYQGVVELKGDSIAMILENHLLQSEQLRTIIVLNCDKTGSAGLLLQELPKQKSDAHHQWNELALLANTLTSQELLELKPKKIIQRLFNEYNIRLFDPQPVYFKCSCSHEKVANMLLSLEYQEAKDIIHQSEFIEVNCEFCNKVYRFDEVDITEIFSAKHKPTIH